MRVETRSREGLPDLGNGLVQGWLQFPKSWEPWGPDLWSLRNAHRTKQATTEGGAESTSSYRTRVWCSESELLMSWDRSRVRVSEAPGYKKKTGTGQTWCHPRMVRNRADWSWTPPSNLSWGCQHGCERIWSKPNLVEPSMVLFNGVQVLEKNFKILGNIFLKGHF